MSIDGKVLTLAELRGYPNLNQYFIPDYDKFRSELLRLKEAYGGKASQYKDEWNKKTRFKKLKATAGELRRNLRKTDEGVIYFSIDEVVEGVKAKFKAEKDKGIKDSVTENTTKTRICRVLNQIVTVEESGDHMVEYRSVAMYPQKGKIGYVFYKRMYTKSR